MSRLTKKNIDGYDLVRNGEIYYVWWNDMTKKVVYKLGNFEDLEEELGCPLEVLIKGVINSNKLGENCHWITPIIINYNGKLIEGFEMKIVDGEYIEVCVDGIDYKNCYDIETMTLLIKDYKKTWWLKGEKDES